MKGVGRFVHSVPEIKMYRVPNARIIGNNSVLDAKNGIYSPAPATVEGDLQALLNRNKHNHQGFIAVRRGSETFAHFGARPSSQRIEKDVLLLHNLEPGNYGSFLFRQLPQILLSAKMCPTYDAYVVPDRTPWLYDCLRLCRMDDKPIYTVREVSGDVLRSICVFNEFDSEGVLSESIREKLRGIGDRMADIDAGPERVFVSRRLNGIFRPMYRRLINEAEVEYAAAEAGFNIVCPETLTFRQQIHLFRNARAIAGPSGSGMLNSMFSPREARVLDMESFAFTVRQHAKIYGSSGLSYAFLFGELDAADTRTNYLRAWRAPVGEVRSALKWAIEGFRA
jgi:capsular polysaccharide biosynthesis protein